MRKITQQAVEAFPNGERFNKGNTSVIIDADTWKLCLHGNCIARIDSYGMAVNPQGYTTATTKERLNGLPNVSIKQRNFEWYLNDSKESMCMNDWTYV